LQEKIWLKAYSSGVPAEADWSAYPSVRHMYQAAVLRYGIRPAFTNMGTTLTYVEVDHLSRNFAGYLQKDLGIAKGDRLAICCLTCSSTPWSCSAPSWQGSPS
jgi:long-chain acyl-CoA synthetase